MGDNVFANGMEVSAKKSGNQSIAAMPDVCLSPPSPPAGPIPIPYPNFSQASDTSGGTRTVKLGGQEAGIKNESNYSTSKGDEAATRGLGMGTVTHTIQGKTKFAAWSMDVKFEGSNVTRFGDITTHNHMNPANSGSTTTSVGSPAAATVPDPECVELDNANKSVHSNDLRPSAKGAAFTATTANFHGGGSTTFIQAVTPKNLVQSSKREGFASSRKPPEKVACTQDTWGGPDSSSVGENRACNHTEPKILGQIFDGVGGQGGAVTMRIQWHQNGGDPQPIPCPNCHIKMCSAAEECDIEISLCDDQHQKKPLEC